MSRIIQNQEDVHVYLEVDGVWYRYDPGMPPLGEGAMGIVYLGFRCNDDTPVAIKKIRQELWNRPLIRNRAKQEASIILDHPNIIRMIGYCEEQPDDGPLYVLSEYISGETIEEHVRHLSDLSTDQRDRKIVEEFIPIVEAASYLHSLGIVHRDIKPDNIMLQEGFLPKLMDLGVAKTDSCFDAHLCGTIGTQPFAAPEQVVPADVEAKVDNRSDIYALGATLQYLITGAFPSDLSGHSDALCSVIGTAVAEKAEDRFEDANLLKDALVSVLDSKPPEKRSRRILFVLLLVLLLVLFTIACILISIYF